MTHCYYQKRLWMSRGLPLVYAEKTLTPRDSLFAYEKTLDATRLHFVYAEKTLTPRDFTLCFYAGRHADFNSFALPKRL
ncbi:hypothetical protein JOB18_021237 [Solea senegalensis]|uniref:Uncharacterized protein n=1 Tax=Solea senegalensis TaxID=28829 RepID=A0AAV6SLQ2_SOLSE|nr:hypothetical protein JOB18_021237 [Solea senegalensis]